MSKPKSDAGSAGGGLVRDEDLRAFALPLFDEPAAPVARAARGSKAAAASKGKPTKTAPAHAPVEEALAPLAERFALDADEVRLLALAWAVERLFDVAAAARARTGHPRGLTAGLLRQRFAGELLAPSGRLRAHGLLLVEGTPRSRPVASDGVWLGPLLGPRLDGVPEAARGAELLGLGVERILPVDRGPVGEALTGVVRDETVVLKPRWVTIAGAGPAEVERFAAAVARRLLRPVIRVDGRVLARLPLGEAFALLACARREADLDESALLVDAAASITPLLEAVSARAGATTRVFVLDERRVPELPAPAGFVTRAVVLEGAGSDAGPSAEGRGEASTASAPPLSPAIDAARRQAAVDAARAMGRPIHLPPQPASPPPPSNQAAPAPAPTAAAAPAQTASTPPPPAASPSPRAAEAPPAERPLTPEERRARAFAHVGSPVPARQRRSDAHPSRPAPAQSPVEPEPAAAAVESAPLADSALATGDPSESAPYLPVPDDASVPDLVRLARECTNPFQRAALLRRLADLNIKDLAISTLMRAYTSAAHPAVRAAAEHGMTCLFGPAWNRARAIPKPVQPPRSDDESPGR